MKVLLYTKPNCVQCDMTKKAFDKGNVKYEIIDLTDRPETAKSLQDNHGVSSAPVVMYERDGKLNVWAGFKYDLIQGLIKQVHAEGAVNA